MLSRSRIILLFSLLLVLRSAAQYRTVYDSLWANNGKDHSVVVMGTDGALISDAAVSVWKKQKDGKLIPALFGIKTMSYGGFSVMTPCSYSMGCDSVMVLRVEHSGYETAEMPLFIFGETCSGTVVTLAEAGTPFYYTTHVSMYRDFRGLRKVPYELDADRLAIKVTYYGRTHPQKLRKFLQKNGMDLMDPELKEYSRRGGVLIKKTSGGAFSGSACEELKMLRKQKKMIAIAGISLNAYTNALTNYLVIRVKEKDAEAIQAYLKEKKWQIIREHGINGMLEGKYEDHSFLVKADDTMAEGMIALQKEILQRPGVLRCDLFFLENNPCLDLSPRYPTSLSKKERRAMDKWAF